jgi:hypothetical protein
MSVISTMSDTESARIPIPRGLKISFNINGFPNAGPSSKLIDTPSLGLDILNCL